MKKKKIKQIIALSLSLLLTTNFLPNNLFKGKPVLAAPVGVYVNSDFENFEGKITDKASFTDSFGNVYWLYNGNNDSYFENKSVDEFKRKSLALINTNNNNAGIYISKPSVTLKNKLVFESDLNFTDKNLERKVSIKLNSADSDMYEIVFKKDGSIVLSNYTKAYGTQVLGTISKEKYDVNKWYNVKFIVNPKTNEIEIYLNNKLLDSRIFDVRSWDAVTELRITQAGHASVATGEVLVDNFKIYDYIDIEEIKVKDLVMNPNTSMELQKVVIPQITAGELIYESSDESIVSVDNYGVVTSGENKGTAEIRVSSLDGKVSTICNVTVDEVVNVEEIILPDNLSVQKGSTLNVEELVEFVPENATNKNIVWSTEDDRKLKVDSNGVLTGVNWGDVKIVAKTQDGNKVASTTVKVRHIVNPPEIESSEYDKIRDRYLYDLTGGDYDYNDENTKGLVDKIFNDAEKFWTSMNKDKENREHVWDDISDSSIEAQGLDQKNTDIKISDAITTGYRRIETMLRAYHMENSPLQGNKEMLSDILDAVEWMYNNKYNENLNIEYGNWWNWEIGTPLALTNIGVLLHDEIDMETMKKYMAPIYFYQPDPFNNCFRELNPTNKAYKVTTGANRSDCSKIAAVLGSLVEDYDQLLMARDAIESLFEYTTEGDGFYTDASFIQHKSETGLGAIPYIGTYGCVFLTGAPTVVEMLKNSPWEVSKEKLTILKEFVDNSLIPYIYKGAMLDMTRGRAISRYDSSDDGSGKTALNTIMMVARVIDDEVEKNELYSFVKGMIELNTYSDHMESIAKLDYRQYPISLVNDLNSLLSGDIEGKVNEEYHLFTPLQDRVVHSRKDYLFGISMFSKRIANFESMNGENKRAWHTSSGMTYLYNDDLGYYKDYWPTINPYRLPGTTVDTITMEDGKGNKSNLDKDWIGGVQLGNYGANGMEYRQIGPRGILNTSTGEMDRLSLEATKSWFMFDDEIVALGAGINSTDGRTIETIVDNIKLKNDNSNNITINGQEANFNKISQNIVLDPKPTEDKEVLEDVKTIFVEGNQGGTSIGYYFPNKAELNFRNVENTSTWQSIGSSGPVKNGQPKEIKNNYLEMWVDHGVNPENDSYEYVILPNKTNDEVQAYNSNPQVEILSNTKELQAVKHKGLNITSFNSFTDSEKNIEYITVDKKSSVMVKVEEDTLTVAVSDPTMLNEEGIIVSIDKTKLPVEGLKSLNIIEGNDVSLIEDTNALVKFKVNTANQNGSAIEVKFNMELEEKVPEDIIVGKVEQLKSINITDESITLQWKSPKETVGLSEYIIYKDGKLIDTIEANEKEYIVDNLKSNTIYGFKIVAKYSNKKESKPKSINERTKK
ncbi:polysaccharide lyase family 8 super-sandwich domain-containing protein [Clostridium sp.]|uniref:polysaccharide lyase family 8 super-sandwich domain-containing protein n=1 Tax=Clostridium sp. TaxID=1506 RepID=UPI003F40C20F